MGSLELKDEILDLINLTVLYHLFEDFGPKCFQTVNFVLPSNNNNDDDPLYMALIFPRDDINGRSILI